MRKDQDFNLWQAWDAACTALEVPTLDTIALGMEKIMSADRPADMMTVDDMRQMVRVTLYLMMTASLIDDDDGFAAKNHERECISAAQVLQQIVVGLAVAKGMIPDPRTAPR